MELSGLVGGVQKFSTGDGPGIRTTVFLKGCPLSCQWCHNPELIDPRNQLMHNPSRCIGCGHCVRSCPQQAISFRDGVFCRDADKCVLCFACAGSCVCDALRTAAKLMTLSQIMELVEQDRGYYQHTGGGLTISGGECLYQLEFTTALVQAALERGLNVALDTSGLGNAEGLYSLARKVNYILYDMKSIDDEVHRQVTGVSNAPILEHLRTLAADQEVRAKLLMRMPLISGINDTPAIIRATRDFYVENGLRQLTLLPYHELGIAKYANLGLERHDFEPPAEERLMEIWQEFESAGIRTEISGREMHPAV